MTETNELKLERSEKWCGRMDDIAYEVSHHSLYMNDGKGIWCYYVYLTSEMLAADDFAKLWLEPTSVASWGASYAYERTPIADCDWHGGITYYEKVAVIDTDRRYIKVGCDFNHLFDHENGYPYDESRVAFEARRTVQAIREAMRFKRRDPYNGQWDYPENMTLQDGAYYTAGGLAKRNEWYAQRQAAKAEQGKE